jgi:hypothetical protein
VQQIVLLLQVEPHARLGFESYSLSASTITEKFWPSILRQPKNL